MNDHESDQQALAAKRKTKATFDSTATIEWVGKHYFPDKARRDAHALGWTFSSRTRCGTRWEPKPMALLRLR